MLGETNNWISAQYSTGHALGIPTDADVPGQGVEWPHVLVSVLVPVPGVALQLSLVAVVKW